MRLVRRRRSFKDHGRQLAGRRDPAFRSRAFEECEASELRFDTPLGGLKPGRFRRSAILSRCRGRIAGGEWVIERVRRIVGGTAMLSAGGAIEVDAFFVYNDNETWAGGAPGQGAAAVSAEARGPGEACRRRNDIVRFSTACPHDAGALDVVGFDAGAPAVMADFIR